MLEKNGEYIGQVVNIGSNGEGIVKCNNETVFVPFCLIDEEIKFKVLKVSNKAIFGKLLEVIKPSANRTEPKCKYFYKCGGCQLQHLKYESQVQLKKDNIKTCFKKIAGLDIEVLDAIKGTKIYKYRNKLQLPVQFDGEKNIIGFYSENSHRVIDIDDCIINPDWTKTIISAFRFFLEKYSLFGLNQVDFSGDIREITVKEIGKNLIITVVGLKKELKNKKELIELLKEKISQNFSLFYNYNNSTSNVIYSDNFSLIYGEENYLSKMNEIIYGTGVRSFSQVNTEVCSLLYDRVIEELNIQSNTTVIDAYSGAGLMTAMIGKKANKVIGIEIVPEAVKIADKLMENNGLKNKVTNYCGKCEDILPKIIEKEKDSKISVVLDPPRKGCDIKVLDSIVKSNVDRIVYVSCMPQTLARDVGLIIGSLTVENNEIVRLKEYKERYKIEKVIPFEMFPNTKHVETLCVLKKI